ncbi:hypothetical protein ABIF64_001731 [Bradyrhizobium japonicum]
MLNRETMIDRLATRATGNETPHWLVPNVWPRACRAGLCRARWIPQWRPIAKAPIPPSDGLPSYWTRPCLIQTDTGPGGHLQLRGRLSALWRTRPAAAARPAPALVRGHDRALQTSSPTRNKFMPLPSASASPIDRWQETTAGGSERSTARYTGRSTDRSARREGAHHHAQQGLLRQRPSRHARGYPCVRQ